jgi:general secretion pathway protein L
MENALSNLRHALRDAAARLELPAFWRWWKGELAPLAPTTPRTALQRRRQRAILSFDTGRAVLWEPRVVDGALTLVESGAIPLGGDAAAGAGAGRAQIEGLARRIARGGPLKVLIALPRAEILRKQLTLPSAVEENLKETLAFDLDRLTPFRADQLYFDAVVVDRDVAKRQIRVDWAAALRTSVDAARRHAESWGALVVGVTPEAPGAVTPARRWSKLNLLPEEDRPETAVWRRPGVLAPAGLLAVLVLVAIVLPIWQKRDYVITLIQLADQARVEAAAADALRQQLDQATGEYNFALGRKYAFASTVQLLEDVTRLLPDDTWLTQLEVKSFTKGKETRREVVLRGESGNAGRLITALEDSKLFEQAAQRSPTTKIQPGPGEVFDLGAQLKPLPPPEAVQLASVSQAAASGPATGGPDAPAAAGTAPAGTAATPAPAGATVPSATTPAPAGTTASPPATGASAPAAATSGSGGPPPAAGAAASGPGAPAAAPVLPPGTAPPAPPAESTPAPRPAVGNTPAPTPRGGGGPNPPPVPAAAPSAAAELRP